MKKISIILAIILITLTGCGKSSTRQTNVANIYEINSGYGYYYAVDKNTSVVYLIYEMAYQRSMTAMLNADGSPVTADQLGLTLDGDENVD